MCSPGGEAGAELLASGWQTQRKLASHLPPQPLSRGAARSEHRGTPPERVAQDQGKEWAVSREGALGNVRRIHVSK